MWSLSELGALPTPHSIFEIGADTPPWSMASESESEHPAKIRRKAFAADTPSKDSVASLIARMSKGSVAGSLSQGPDDAIRFS